MKKLNALNLGKSLNRSEMKSIFGGTENPNENVYDCTCGTRPTAHNVRGCTCVVFCAGGCPQ